ncbi:MAG: SMI1/KNR4 family protein [Bryobacterales bacterium]|nr:SMI1/KNR4 family protein [Bryobacterales bacterium]
MPTELIQRINAIIPFPLLRTEYGDHHAQPDLYSPVSPEIIAAAEGDLRFRLPPLLVQCYTEIGNGGFGPGHGLIGLESEDGDAFRHDLTDACLAELYTAYREEALRRPWPKGLLPLFLKGDGAMDCIQATKPPYLVAHLKDDATLDRTTEPFEAYLQTWAEAMETRGRDLGLLR